MSPVMSLCLFFLFFVSALAAPVDHDGTLAGRTVYAPPIVVPNATTVWTTGSVETVTWDATGIPAGVTGMIMLGFLTSDSENLSTTLASGFNLTDEKVDITVPSGLVTRNNYIIVLFGDSGNISPKFTIEGSAAASPSGSASGKAGGGGGGGGQSLTPPIPSTSSTAATGPAPSLSATPSPPIATASSSGSAPASTPTAPPPSSASASAPSSASGSASGVVSASPSPSPSTGAGWSVKMNMNSNFLTTSQVFLAPATALLLLLL